MDSTNIELTETEKLIGTAQQAGMISAKVSVRGMLITALIQAILGTLMSTYISEQGPYAFWIPVGRILMCLGVVGTLIYSADLMKMEKRNQTKP